MTRPTRAVLSAPLVLLLLALALTACGDGGGDTIRGTVTIGGEPAEGLPVELLEGGEEEPVPGEEGVVVDSTTTDAEGAFAFDAEVGEYSVNVKDLPMEGTGGCVVLVPFVSVGEDSTSTLSLDAPTEPPSGGITFIDPFWFACFEA